MFLFADGAILQLDPAALAAGLGLAGGAIGTGIAAAVRMLVNYQREKDAQLLMLLDTVMGLPIGTTGKAARDVRKKMKLPTNGDNG
jgi:hypothetical protein